jgi:PAS domain S-box-containing protein
LKVDRSFVSSMTHRRESRKIVAAVVGLGQSLGLTAVAEGVETREQAEMLLWMGCEQGQGWFYGRPEPGEELATVVSTLRSKFKNELPNHWRAALSSNLDALPSQRLAQLQAVYDGAPVGLAFLDCNLRYVNLNRRLADMNGATVEEHLGSSVEEMLPEVFAKAEPYLRRALKGEAISGIEIKRTLAGETEEESFAVSYQPACDESGEVVGLSVALLETTGLKRAEEALRENVALLDALPVGLVVADASGSGASVANPEAMQIFSDAPVPGVDAPAAPWSSAATDVKLMESADLLMERALHGLTTEVEEVLAERNDGSALWVQRSGAPILGQGGEVTGAVVVIKEIDELKREREHPSPSDEKLVEPDSLDLNQKCNAMI